MRGDGWLCTPTAHGLGVPTLGGTSQGKLHAPVVERPEHGLGCSVMALLVHPEALCPVCQKLHRHLQMQLS